MMLPRRSLGVLALASCAAALISCGGDDADSATTAAPTTAAVTTTTATDATPVTTEATAVTSTTAAPASTFPVTIEHAYGSVTIEQAPQRIITLGWLESDIVTALGTEPIAVSAFPFSESLLTPWLESELTTTPETFESAGSGGTLPALNYERMLALRPDLIIATSYIDIADQYDQLSSIAPVLGPSQPAYQHLPWADQITAIGTALGQDAAAAELVEQTEALVTDAIASTPVLDGATYTLALGVPGSLRLVQDPDDSGLQLLDRFGMVLNPRLAELASLGDGSGGAAVSPENAEYADADVVLIAYTSDAARDEWESNPVFQAVPAVAEGRYLAIDTTSLSALRNPSPFSLPYAIEHLVVGGAAEVLS